MDWVTTRAESPLPEIFNHIYSRVCTDIKEANCLPRTTRQGHTFEIAEKNQSQIHVYRKDESENLVGGVRLMLNAQEIDASKHVIQVQRSVKDLHFPSARNWEDDFEVRVVWNENTADWDLHRCYEYVENQMLYIARPQVAPWQVSYFALRSLIFID